MAENEKWITLKNGKRVKLDENGTVIAGFPDFMGKNIKRLKGLKIGELTSFTKPSKSFEKYLQENNGDKTEAFTRYFNDNFLNKYISTKMEGQDVDILFTAATRREFRRKIDSGLKASFLDDIPEVLQYYKNSDELTHKRNDFSEFIYFEHVIEKEIKGKKVKATVNLNVGKVKNSENEYRAHHYYVNKIAEDTKKTSVTAESHHFTPAEVNEFQNGTLSRLLQLAFDENIRPQYEIVNIEIDIPEDEPMNNKKTVIFDSKSKRSFDINGFMHVELSNLTKESVDPYFGYEIVNSEALGFEPDKIYFGYRKGEELAKAAQSFNGLPLMREHHFDSAEKPQREHRVGSVGTNCVYNAPYLQASLTITDGEAIRKIESGERMELSCSYFYKAIVEKGEFNGQPYDFVMTDIQGNHVALVEEDRGKFL